MLARNFKDIRRVSKFLLCLCIKMIKCLTELTKRPFKSTFPLSYYALVAHYKISHTFPSEIKNILLFKLPAQLFSPNTFSTNTFCPNTRCLITNTLLVWSSLYIRYFPDICSLLYKKPVSIFSRLRVNCSRSWQYVVMKCVGIK